MSNCYDYECPTVMITNVQLLNKDAQNGNLLLNIAAKKMEI